MALIDWLKHRWQSEAVHYTYLWIPTGNIEMPPDTKLDPTPLSAGQRYFRIWLVEMFLKDDRKWGASWYPAVMLSVQLKFGNKVEEITHIAGESTLKNFDMKALNKGVAVDHEVTTLLPFNGGTVNLEAALLAMEGKSDLRSLLKVLGDFSKLLVVPQLSAALAVATPLANGIAELVGATNAHPELRLQAAWTGAESGNPNLLRAGYFVVLSAEAGEIKPEELSVKNNQLHKGGKQLTGYHYMLFRVDTTDVRDDWDSLTSISEPYKLALDMLEESTKSDDEELKKKLKSEAEKRFGASRFAALRAPELTSIVGKNQVLNALDRRWEEAKKQVGAGAFKADFPKTLSAAMRNPLSATEAMELGEPEGVPLN